MTQLCVRHWTPKHVARWLKEEGFCDYVDLLCNKHRLDGTSLLALSEYDLRSPPLELKVLGDIKRLMMSIRKLQKQNMDVLEELGVPFDGLSPSSSGSNLEWLCNGDPGRDCDGTHTAPVGEEYKQYTNGKYKQQMRRLDPEYWKTVLSSVYVVFVFGFTSFVMVIVHERVPDMRTYPPLPDIFLDRLVLTNPDFCHKISCGMHQRWEYIFWTSELHFYKSLLSSQIPAEETWPQRDHGAFILSFFFKTDLYCFFWFWFFYKLL